MVEDTLIEILESFSLPVIRQGSLPPDEAYPPAFITFWNNETIEHSAYDNETTSITYDYDVNVYASDPEVTYSQLRQIGAALKAQGWIITDFGFDIASDEITHTGRGMQAVYLETTKGE